MATGINFMKTFIFSLLALLISFNIFAGTCSSISYTSSTANSTLTSTKYNTDNTTIYNFVNAYDAGCVTSGTLEKDALNTSTATGFAVPLNGIVDGCKVTQLTAATLQISNCIASVNNNWVKTTTPTNVAWTDLDTGSEAASTFYYVYMDSTSDTTTLTPVISATVPGSDGLNGSDRALARFYNDSGSDIVSSVTQWHVNELLYGPISARYDSDAGQEIPNGTETIVNFDSTTLGYDIYSAVTTGASWKFTAPLAGVYHISFGCLISGAFDAGETVIANIYKNNIDYARTFWGEAHAGGTFVFTPNGATDMYMAKGDYFDIRLYQNSGGALNLDNNEEYVFVSVHRVE